MIDTKNITKEMQDDRAFISAAVSCELIDLIKKEHEEWLDNGGFQSYYDLVVKIVDYMMFTEGSMYLNFLHKKEDNNKVEFSKLANDCFDWFHIKLAKALVTKELLHEVCYGDPKKYFAELEVAKKEASKKQMVKQVIPPAQVEIIQRALNVLELSLKEQNKVSHDENISYTIFDIVTLRGILKGEVSVVWAEEDTKGFSFKHSVDFPDYGDDFPLERL